MPTRKWYSLLKDLTDHVCEQVVGLSREPTEDEYQRWYTRAKSAAASDRLVVKEYVGELYSTPRDVQSWLDEIGVGFPEEFWGEDYEKLMTPCEPGCSPELPTRAHSKNLRIATDNAVEPDTYVLIETRNWLTHGNAKKRLKQKLGFQMHDSTIGSHVSRGCDETDELTFVGKGRERRIEPNSVDALAMRLREEHNQEEDKRTRNLRDKR